VTGSPCGTNAVIVGNPETKRGFLGRGKINSLYALLSIIYTSNLLMSRKVLII
jgi:hypothetical protein